jgi:formate dehydrogenase maturation protein FdhE
MISDRRRGSKQGWTSRAKSLAEQVTSARAKKVNLRDLARKLKADNYEGLTDCVMLESIETLLAESRIPKSAEATELVGKLQAFEKEGVDLRAKAVAAKESEHGDNAVKDVVVEAVKLKVRSTDADQL